MIERKKERKKERKEEKKKGKDIKKERKKIIHRVTAILKNKFFTQQHNVQSIVIFKDLRKLF